MPLDPQFADIIAYYRNIPPIEQLPLAALRGGQRRPQGDKTPVDEVSDRSVPGPDGDIELRVYRCGGDAKAPLLLFMHGGGFVLGDLESHDELARFITAKTGCVTVSVQYRLAPEHPYPAAVDDCFSALCWAAANARELGADPDRVVVIGDSAGGNLAAAMALKARAEGGPALAGQVLIYPVTDLTAHFPPAPDGEYYLVYPALHDFFLASYISEEAHLRLPTASPGLAEDLGGLPPALVITAEYDPLCDQGNAFAARLRDAAVATAHTCYPGAIHGFASNPLPMRAEAVEEIADWVRSL